MKKYLILSNRFNNEKNKLPIDKLLLIGEWCKLSKEKNFFLRKADVIQYHWRDRLKRSKDSIYLNNLYEEVLDKLSNKLNHIHKLNFTKRLWRIIIGPWLLTYIPVIFDRWEIINVAMNRKNEITLVLDKSLNSKNFVPTDFDNSVDYYTNSQKYNEMLFKRVLDFKYKKHKRIFYEVYESNKVDNKKKNFLIQYKKLIIEFLKYYFKKFMNYFHIFLSKFLRYKIIFYKSYINKWDLILLFLRFKQIPYNFFVFNQKN